MKILIVDDEVQLVKAVSAILRKNNYNTDCAYDGEDGLDKALSNIYDVIILDIMLPKRNGYEIIQELRNNRISTPVLMLSAKSQTYDKIYGLNLGADDYLAKPFESEELLARIKALLRRKNEFVGDTLTYGDLSLNRDNCSLLCNGQEISLGKKEFQILEMLILNGGKAINKERLIEKIWGFDTDAEYNAIEVHVSFLRKKLNLLSSAVNIRSLRGIGYILEDNNAKSGQN
ncbi:MAG: DNA-binding response regulator [Bacillota bacterium]|nr:MAG: DNA-binding response regulator [Bacillota bacterium]